MTRSSPSLLFVHTAPLFGPEKFPTRLFLLLDVFRFDLIDQSRLSDVAMFGDFPLCQPGMYEHSHMLNLRSP